MTLTKPMRLWLLSVGGLLLFLVAAYVLITYGLPLVMPFVIALIVAELMDPIVIRISGKKKLSRSLAVGLVLLLFVGLFSTVITVAIARLVEEIRLVVVELPNLFPIAMQLGTEFAEQFGRFNESLPVSIQEMLVKNLEAVESSVVNWLKNLTSVLGVVTSVPSLVTNLLIAFIATFFISRDRGEIGDFLLSLFPHEWRDQIRRVKNDVWTSTIGWAKAQFMLILLTMIQTIIGLELIGAEYSVTMGVVVGLADVMPVLGPAAVYVPWISYCFIFGDKVFGLKLLILYAVVAAVRQVLEVKVVGDQIGLHPLAILLSLYLGFHFLGALGFVLGPLLAILLKSMIKSGLLTIFQHEEPPK